MSIYINKIKESKIEIIQKNEWKLQVNHDPSNTILEIITYQYYTSNFARNLSPTQQYGNHSFHRTS